MSSGYVNLPIQSGGGGVSSLNTLTGDLALTSNDGSISIYPSSDTVDLSANANPAYLKKDGSNSPTAAMNWGGQTLTNLADPSTPQGAVTVAYLDTHTALDSFTIMQPDHGTSPTATSASDTLTFTSSDSTATITGNSSTKTLNFQIAPIDLATKVTGVLPVANGGTASSTSLNNNRFMVSSGSKIVEAAAVTASKVLVSDTNGLPTASSVTTTTLGYLDATSSIQTQINALQPTSESSAGTSGTSKTITYSSSVVAQSLTMSGNCTATLAGLSSGQAYILRVIQGASPYTLAITGAKYPGGTPITISTASGAVDILNIYYDGTNTYVTFAQAFA